MARTRSIESIEIEIQKTTDKLEKVEARMNTISEKLLELQKQKQALESKKVIDAFKKSDRSLQELMTFLGV